MHRSRLAGFIIDCQTTNLETAADFWSNALGLPRRAQKDPEDISYIGLESEARDLHIEVQQVDHPSRVHLDIETDDIEAEVRRLEALGAKRLRQVRTWWIMEAPTGHRFCVVRPQGAAIASEANRWE
jgi:predicted enzyme related to lactoylglutathione lyase